MLRQPNYHGKKRRYSRWGIYLENRSFSTSILVLRPEGGYYPEQDVKRIESILRAPLDLRRLPPCKVEMTGSLLLIHSHTWLSWEEAETALHLGFVWGPPGDVKWQRRYWNGSRMLWEHCASLRCETPWNFTLPLALTEAGQMVLRLRAKSQLPILPALQPELRSLVSRISSVQKGFLQVPCQV